MQFFVSDKRSNAKVDHLYFIEKLQLLSCGDLVMVLGSHLSVVATLMFLKMANLIGKLTGHLRRSNISQSGELLNWKVDKSHHSNTILFNRYNDPALASFFLKCH